MIPRDFRGIGLYDMGVYSNGCFAVAAPGTNLCVTIDNLTTRVTVRRGLVTIDRIKTLADWQAEALAQCGPTFK